MTSGSFSLVSFSESRTSCLRKPPGTTDRGGGGEAWVSGGFFSSFICGGVKEVVEEVEVKEVVEEVEVKG